jgi:predicted RNA-binding Zn-ribbon protein involved in translation (DUF1610 family)
MVLNLSCPSCGAEVEFFFDDTIRLCPECGSKIRKSDPQLLKDFGCVDWCEAAERCIGTELWIKLRNAKKRKESREP